jgi:PTH1 family peptidyl-tRNA hydrolase
VEGVVKIVVGLGNPGPQYAHNRHNVGYQVAERVAQHMGASSGRVMIKAYTLSGALAGTKVLVARPLTFMNLSGLAVGPLLRWYHASTSELLVICDDLDLPLSRIRLRPHGGSGGHKGLRSIIEALGTQDFARLRIGIGRPSHGDPEDYVLNDFAPDELIGMLDAYDRAVEAVESFVLDGIVVAMNQFNPPGELPDPADNGE